MTRRITSSILRLFFNLLYHQFAWTYDWIADIVSIGRWKSWVHSVIPYLGDAEVLELGCGPGHLLIAVSDQGGRIIGLDPSQQMLKLAGRNLSKHNHDKKLVLARAQDLPFRDQAIPVIAATFPSSYIYEAQTLEQVYRVLQDGGQLVILPVAWITGSSFLDKLTSWLFKITGESFDFDSEEVETRFEKPVERLSDKGFKVSLERIDSETSKVLLIRAIKRLPVS